MDDQTAAGGPLDVYQMITMMVDQMAAVAWTKMGLQPDFVTGKVEAPDLDQAKVAIDLTTHMSTFIEPKLEEDDKRRIHALIRDLRMNWVQRSQGSGT